MYFHHAEFVCKIYRERLLHLSHRWKTKIQKIHFVEDNMNFSLSCLHLDNIRCENFFLSVTKWYLGLKSISSDLTDCSLSVLLNDSALVQNSLLSWGSSRHDFSRICNQLLLADQFVWRIETKLLDQNHYLSLFSQQSVLGFNLTDSVSSFTSIILNYPGEENVLLLLFMPCWLSDDW